MSEDDFDPPAHKLWDLATLGIVPEQPSPDDDWTYKQYLACEGRHKGKMEGDTPSILDLIFTQKAEDIENLDYEIPRAASDHCILVFGYMIELIYVTKGQEVWERKVDHRKGDYRRIRDYLGEVLWEEEIRGKTVQDMTDLVMRKCMEAEERFIPKVKEKEIRDVMETKISEIQGVMETKISAILGLMETKISEIRGVVETKISKIRGVVETKISEIRGMMEAKISEIRGMMETKISEIRGMMETKISEIRGMMETKISEIRGVVETKISEIRGMMETKISEIRGMMETKISEIRGVMETKIIEIKNVTFHYQLTEEPLGG
ncbi:apolipoprotein A-I-2-like [Procambarus clarkii]|uniref:apolipoprotein A-I-2-like n=1 Tax=Procambarus clarkii TaxID=6728 RepID=UPI0037432696